MVLDCTEVFAERPSELRARKQLFSNYKHHSAIKFLVGSSPSESVVYVSKVWGGRPSDKKITWGASGCLDWLQPCEAVMADSGFLLEEEVAERGCQLYMPACQSCTTDCVRGDPDQAYCLCTHSRRKSDPTNQALPHYKVVFFVVVARQ